MAQTTLALPYNLQNGASNDASQVMANFNQIATTTNANFTDATSFVASGTNAATRTQQNKSRDVVCIADFIGDDPTGVADTLATFNSAITALPAGGGAIFVPHGTRNVSGTVSLTKQIQIYGEGFASIVSTSSATADVFLFANNYCEIDHLQITSSVTRTAGWFLNITSNLISRCRISNFWMFNAIGGIRSGAAGSITIQHGEMFNFALTTGVGIRIDNGVDNTILDVLCDGGPGGQLAAGVLITACGDCKIVLSQFIKCGIGLYLNPGTGQEVDSVWSSLTDYDQCTRGVYMLAAGGKIQRSMFDTCWASSATQQGVVMDVTGAGTINGIEFDNHNGYLNGSDAISILNVAVTNVRIKGGGFSQNAGAAVNLAANVGDFIMQGARCGPTDGFAGNAYGVFIAGGTGNNILVTGNHLVGNTTANLVNGATGASVTIEDNLGVSDAWITFTPTITTGTGTITTLGTVVGKYRRRGRCLFLNYDIAITTNGTGATSLLVTLPTGFTSLNFATFVARDNAAGTGIQGIASGLGGLTISLTKMADNTYPAINGSRIIVTGTIEAS